MKSSIKCLTSYFPKTEVFSEKQIRFHELTLLVFKNFIQNKSQATKTENRKSKIAQVNSKASVNILSLKNKTKTIDTFLSIIPSRTLSKILHTSLPEISCKQAGKAFLDKIKSKMLVQAMRIL